MARDEDNVVPTLPSQLSRDDFFGGGGDDPGVSVCSWVVALIFGLKIILLILYVVMGLSHCMFTRVGSHACACTAARRGHCTSSMTSP